MSEGSTKENIIREASSVFAKYGYRKANLDDIAARLSKGKSFIYYYFKNKEAVFRAVLLREAEQLTNALEKVRASDGSACRKLKSFVLVKVKTLREIANYYNSVKDDYFREKGFFKKIRMETEGQELLIVREIFKEGISSGEFKDIDFEWAAESFLTALKGFELPLLRKASFENIEKRADELLNLLFYGIVNNTKPEKDSVNDRSKDGEAL